MPSIFPEIRDKSWRDALADEFKQPYMAALETFLAERKAQGAEILPPQKNWFAALDLTPLDSVRAVILGQDPYHGLGQAHGLCFSVQSGVRPPPSLVNIFKELQGDLGLARPTHGNLEHWARQGVLLLNSVLTVEAGKAGAHANGGWERFTDAVIARVSAVHSPVAFLLWGAYAQRKAACVDPDRHLVLTAPHPSPLSAYTGFFGCRHFSTVNAFLGAQGLSPIDWELP
jgi:uracil-DNA glycosylase